MKKVKKAVKSTKTKSSPVRASKSTSSTESPSVIIQMGVVFIIVAAIVLAWYMGMRMSP